MILIIGKGFHINIPVEMEYVINSVMYQNSDFGDICIETERMVYIIAKVYHADEVVDAISSAIRSQIKSGSATVVLDNYRAYHDYAAESKLEIIEKGEMKWRKFDTN